ncbi:MAG TPA: hypothetical protein VMG08_03520 [Allosphingosinicella sp.]|nr:hypothetical protein [Allosphingosinicella sp.]
MPQVKSFRILAATALGALLLGACTTATPYQPLGARGTGASGGFSEVRIAPTRYRVTFAGNSMTSRERVETYLLFRAAELTREQGYDSFTIVDRATDRTVETRVYQDPFGPGRYRYWRPYWRYRGAYGWRRWDPWYGDPFWANDIDVRTVQNFEASAEIIMARGGPRDDKGFVAREVIESLGPTIELPR